MSGKVVTVVIRDDGPMIHANDGPAYRTVRFSLAEWQCELLKFGDLEAISRVIVEDAKDTDDCEQCGGPISSERMTLDELLVILEGWKKVASGQTCVSFVQLCYGASSLWHQSHMDNFRAINRKPKALSEWILKHEGSIHNDFPSQVLEVLKRLSKEPSDDAR